MKQVKKVFNVEYDLTSDEFKATKQDMISEKCQTMHPDYICKVTTFCVPDKQLVVATTEENRAFMGASDKLLAHRPLAEQSFMNLDDDMVKTYEITITADTNLPDYLTAIDVAQAKADEMFEADDSKLPLVTVIDYRWGNAPMTLSASVFGDVDENGNTIPLVNATAPMTVGGGNSANGKTIIENLNKVFLCTADSSFVLDILPNYGAGDFEISLNFEANQQSTAFPNLIGTKDGWNNGSFSLRFDNTSKGILSLHIHNEEPYDFLISSPTLEYDGSKHKATVKRVDGITSLYLDDILVGTSDLVYTLNFGDKNGVIIGKGNWNGHDGTYIGKISNVSMSK